MNLALIAEEENQQNGEKQYIEENEEIGRE